MFRLIFSLFLLFFFAKSQDDVVNLLISGVVGHPVTPWPWLCALLLTAVLMLLAWGLDKLLSRTGADAFTSCMVVAWVSAAAVSAPFTGHSWQAGLLLVAVALIALNVLWERRLRTACPAPRTLWQNFMLPVARLLVLCLFTGLGAGAADTDHYELRTAIALRTGHSQRAYKVGEHALAASQRLFALRCYLIATTQAHGLGEKVFEQPVPATGGSANLLLPADVRQSLMLPCDSLYHLLGAVPQPGEQPLPYLRRCALAAHAAHASQRGERLLPAVDYYLSALLLERRIDDFAREVKYFYPLHIEKSKLPAYFAQALIFYSRKRSNPAIRYSDTAVEANYHDYSEMGDTISNLQKRCNLLRRSYGETYWWWYEYGR